MKAVFLAVVLAGLLTAPAHAQFGVPWQRVPTVVVIAKEDDPRLELVDEAVSYWNGILIELGSGFRLGVVSRQALAVPDEALRALSESIGTGRPQVPEALRGLPGDINIVLADSHFLSFTGPFDPDGKRVVGIRGLQFPPMGLPNVARNVIAHELGHAIGLGHNADPASLMCGRPASCRPDAFISKEPRLLPVSDEERRRLRAMYPAGWRSK
jgi:hypothetical protein